jgi:antitoxin component of MazEF toxin-antitoxin module
MEEEDKQIFLAAAILLPASVAQKHEPVDELQVRLAVVNARKLRNEVEKRSEIIGAGQPYGLTESEKRQGS